MPYLISHLSVIIYIIYQSLSASSYFDFCIASLSNAQEMNFDFDLDFGVKCPSKCQSIGKRSM